MAKETQVLIFPPERISAMEERLQILIETRRASKNLLSQSIANKIKPLYLLLNFRKTLLMGLGVSVLLKTLRRVTGNGAMQEKAWGVTDYLQAGFLAGAAKPAYRIVKKTGFLVIRSLLRTYLRPINF